MNFDDAFSRCPTCGREWGGYDTVGRALVTFTPEMAGKFVGKLSSPENAARYVRVMQAGKWDPMITPLKIWPDGTMWCGFTRMAACVNAGVPVEFLVEVTYPVTVERHDGHYKQLRHVNMYSEDDVRRMVTEWTSKTS